jgi:hypothetical protein
MYMFVQQVHKALVHSTVMHYRHAEGSTVMEHWSMNKTMDMDMHHRHGHRASTCNKDIDAAPKRNTLHRPGHAASIRSCSIDMDIQHHMHLQHGQGHAASTWTCSIDTVMPHRHELPARTGKCSRHRHAAWTWTSSRDMDIHGY